MSLRIMVSAAVVVARLHDCFDIRSALLTTNHSTDEIIALPTHDLTSASTEASHLLFQMTSSFSFSFVFCSNGGTTLHLLHGHVSTGLREPSLLTGRQLLSMHRHDTPYRFGKVSCHRRIVLADQFDSNRMPRIVVKWATDLDPTREPYWSFSLDVVWEGLRERGERREAQT